MEEKKEAHLFNFGNSDTHIQQWRSFEVDSLTYDLTHLAAHIVDYTNSENNEDYRFYVTYSHHCFCKTEKGFNHEGKWRYPFEKDPRHFHPIRYELSKYLPKIIKNLPSSHTGHAGYDSYAISEIETNGVTTCYFVVFVVFKSNKKFRIHVESAYPLDVRPKMKKINFFTIAKALKTGKPLPKPYK
jgi:hypothetical protein